MKQIIPTLEQYLNEARLNEAAGLELQYYPTSGQIGIDSPGVLSLNAKRNDMLSLPAVDKLYNTMYKHELKFSRGENQDLKKEAIKDLTKKGFRDVTLKDGGMNWNYLAIPVENEKDILAAIQSIIDTLDKLNSSISVVDKNLTVWTKRSFNRLDDMLNVSNLYRAYDPILTKLNPLVFAIDKQERLADAYNKITSGKLLVTDDIASTWCGEDSRIKTIKYYQYEGSYYMTAETQSSYVIIKIEKCPTNNDLVSLKLK